MNWKNRLTNYNFWVSIVSAVILILQALKIEFDIIYINEIVTAVLGLLVVIGIINDPTKTHSKPSKQTIDKNELSNEEQENEFQENEQTEQNKNYKGQEEIIYNDNNLQIEATKNLKVETDKDSLPLNKYLNFIENVDNDKILEVLENSLKKSENIANLTENSLNLQNNSEISLNNEQNNENILEEKNEENLIENIDNIEKQEDVPDDATTSQPKLNLAETIIPFNQEDEIATFSIQTNISPTSVEENMPIEPNTDAEIQNQTELQINPTLEIPIINKIVN